jgi:hypothetical protein
MGQMKIPNLVTDHQFLGLELDWLGVDDEGALGLFCSAGFGPVPKEALDCAQSIGATTNHFLNFPQVSEVKVLKPLKEWEEMGKRGIYVFDWSHEFKGYVLAVAPTQPIRQSNKRILEVLSLSRPAKIEGRFSDEG